MKVDVEMLVASRSGLLRNARRIVGLADAEDVVQDAFERAWRAATAQANIDPRPWLNRIARNAAFDVLRKRPRTVELGVLRYNAESAESMALRHEKSAIVGVALHDLPQTQRRTIVLHDVAGYSSREIAQLDGVAYHTVRTRLFRARRSMREALCSASKSECAPRPGLTA